MVVQKSPMDKENIMKVGDLVVWKTKWHVKDIEIISIILKTRQKTAWIRPLLPNKHGEEYLLTMGEVASMGKIPVPKSECEVLA